ncbi:hypothetical protein Mapa_010237 [Marchantia paleacea]|nr:hypothetical protein Mapa_010237 [Marchantia paleacea]
MAGRLQLLQYRCDNNKLITSEATQNSTVTLKFFSHLADSRLSTPNPHPLFPHHQRLLQTRLPFEQKTDIELSLHTHLDVAFFASSWSKHRLQNLHHYTHSD